MRREQRPHLAGVKQMQVELDMMSVAQLDFEPVGAVIVAEIGRRIDPIDENRGLAAGGAHGDEQFPRCDAGEFGGDAHAVGGGDMVEDAVEAQTQIDRAVFLDQGRDQVTFLEPQSDTGELERGRGEEAGW